ncbi:MAG: hypothetical protein ACRC5T_05065 [Cetobacterium sp.]
MNATNIYKQAFEDGSSKFSKNIFEFSNQLYSKYLNTLNNEEFSYLNVEDERTVFDNKYIKSSEIGININGNTLLRVGSCNRNLFLKTHGALRSDRQVEELEIAERNQLIKEQWIKKLGFCELLFTPETIKYNYEIDGVVYKTTEDAFMMDTVTGKTFALLIKPVNDSAFSVKDKIWPNNTYVKPSPMSLHLPEALTLLYLHKMPVKLLYVGKNNASSFKEFNIGIKGGCITVNGDIIEGINLSEIMMEMGLLKKMNDNSIVPPRSYISPRVLEKEEATLLFDNGIINNQEKNKLYEGSVFEHFQCKGCAYRDVCNSLPEKEWTNWEW